MSEPRDLRDLVGDDVPAEELERLRRVDALLRSAPAPPATVPERVTRAVFAAAERPTPIWTRRRLGAALALAAALSALFFGLGRWSDGGDFEALRTVPMRATEHAPRAAATIKVGERDASGNWTIEFEVSGLRPLPPGGSYVLWLAKDGEYAATCGYFAAGDGKTTVRMNAAYRLADYDAWVVTAHLPDQPDDEPMPWLLRADVRA